MGLDAVGAYLRTLRKAQPKMTQRKLAAELDVAYNTIWRYENGVQAPTGQNLGRLLEMLGGRIEDFSKLLDNPNATEADGVALAREARVIAAQLSDRDLEYAMRLLDRLKDDPVLLGRWLEYGKQLSESD